MNSIDARAHLLVGLTLVLTVYAQLAVKKQVLTLGQLPEGVGAKLVVLLPQLVSPWLLSALVATFIAGLCWMTAMTRLQLSYAYPFMSLSFVFVLLLSSVFFQEPVTPGKLVGTLIIVVGLWIATVWG